MKVKNYLLSKKPLPIDTTIPVRYATQLKNKKGEWYFPGGTLTHDSMRSANKILKVYSLGPKSFKDAVGKTVRFVRFDPVVVKEVDL